MLCVNCHLKNATVSDTRASVKQEDLSGEALAPHNPTITPEDVASGKSVWKLQKIALQESYHLRLQAIKELGQVATRDAADVLLKVAKEWSHQKGLSDNPNKAVAEQAGSQFLKEMIDVAHRPRPMSFEEFRTLRKKTVSDATSSVLRNLPADPMDVPVDAIASALAEIGTPAIEAMAPWLSIKVHPAIADVIMRTAVKIGGDQGISILERVSRSYVDPETAELAKQTAERIRRSGERR